MPRFAWRRAEGRPMDSESAHAARSPSPLPWGEVGSRGDPGEGVRPITNGVTLHPNPLPIEVGSVRLRQFEMPNSGKPELGGEGARCRCRATVPQSAYFNTSIR